MYLIASGVVFVIYFANVAVGAYTRSAVLGDVAEMLVLFVAVILFVIAILQKEATAKQENGK